MAALAFTLAPARAGAAAEGKSKQPTAAAKADDAAAPSARNPIKVRPGSLLRRNEPLEEQPDLRGDFERRRDLELVRHYGRLAELDVIAAIAKRADDLPLLDRTEEVRRREIERFYAAMQLLREVAQEKAMNGNR